MLETRLNFDLFAKNKKPTVLIADDNVDMRIFIKSILSSYCTILEAEDGQQAIDLVRNSDIDLLLCDIQMPKMSGLDVLTAIRSDPQLRHLLVILISARAGEEASVEGLASVCLNLTNTFSCSHLVIFCHFRVLMVRCIASACDPRDKTDTRSEQTI